MTLDSLPLDDDSAVDFMLRLAENPDLIEGMKPFKDCRFIGYDLVNRKVVEGSDDYDEVADNLYNAHGEDYSLRCMIFHIKI